MSEEDERNISSFVNKFTLDVICGEYKKKSNATDFYIWNQYNVNLCRDSHGSEVEYSEQRIFGVFRKYLEVKFLLAYTTRKWL